MDSLALLVAAPSLNLQLIVNGVLVGAIFALVAYGMALVWGVMNVINIAQGELVMLGGYIVWYLAGAGVPPLLALPAAGAGIAALGWLLYHAVIRRLVARDLFSSLLATFGVGILIQQLANQLFGADVRTVDSGLSTWFFADGLVTLAQVKLVAFAVALLLAFALAAFLRRSRLGQAIRATAQNPRAARILGIPADRVYAATFAVNGAICGVAGGLVAMTWIIHPYLGLTYTVRSFMIVVVAGVGNFAAVLLAGAGLGVAEDYAGFVLGAEYQAAFVFCLLVAILVLRSLRLRRRRQVLR
jgi:branched-chain amino acid transport system permease protein